MLLLTARFKQSSYTGSLRENPFDGGKEEFGLEINLNVPVYCDTEACGHSRYIIIHPGTQIATHFVVATDTKFDPQELVIPLDWIQSSDAHKIVLSHKKEEVLKATPLRDIHYLIVWDPTSGMAPGGFILWPYAIVDQEHTRLNVPQGEVLVDRGAEVMTSDGKTIGRVDEFILNPENEKITHMLLREGHLWSHKEFSIPVRSIQKIESGKVYLSLDSKAISEMQPLPVR